MRSSVYYLKRWNGDLVEEPQGAVVVFDGAAEIPCRTKAERGMSIGANPSREHKGFRNTAELRNGKRRGMLEKKLRWKKYRRNTHERVGNKRTAFLNNTPPPRHTLPRKGV